ncbi:hypothetical protein A5668_09105 [Mycolicibacterium fortuitum]|uniref:hypothetical protein n=1 Tax=Mycolicibacterium fortuitum TaxID=1766 RepID=UPI0007EBC02E|nr:hypothetical protein [Mycolicibacterium fortuitum]OBA94650.1 hypothetical protein A5668_09105 [Mycolicibacterium fortuitum]
MTDRITTVIAEAFAQHRVERCVGSSRDRHEQWWQCIACDFESEHIPLAGVMWEQVQSEVQAFHGAEVALAALKAARIAVVDEGSNHRGGSMRYLRLFADDPDKKRVFPTPIEPHAADQASVGWKLNYAPESLTREDHMYAASVISAYAYLVCEMTAKDRQSVVSEIRRLLAEQS